MNATYTTVIIFISLPTAANLNLFAPKSQTPLWNSHVVIHVYPIIPLASVVCLQTRTQYASVPIHSKISLMIRGPLHDNKAVS